LVAVYVPVTKKWALTRTLTLALALALLPLVLAPPRHHGCCIGTVRTTASMTLSSDTTPGLLLGLMPVLLPGLLPELLPGRRTAA
jgi:hypothetical protein